MWKPPSSRNNADCDCRVNPPCLFITLLPSCVCLFIFVKPCFRLPVALTYFWSSRAPLAYWSFFGIIRRWIKIITGQLFFIIFLPVFVFITNWAEIFDCQSPGCSLIVIFFLMKTSVRVPEESEGTCEAGVYWDDVCNKRGEKLEISCLAGEQFFWTSEPVGFSNMEHMFLFKKTNNNHFSIKIVSLGKSSVSWTNHLLANCSDWIFLYWSKCKTYF